MELVSFPITQEGFEWQAFLGRLKIPSRSQGNSNVPFFLVLETGKTVCHSGGNRTQAIAIPIAWASHAKYASFFQRLIEAAGRAVGGTREKLRLEGIHEEEIIEWPDKANLEKGASPLTYCS
jgi:hypothetical protein